MRKSKIALFFVLLSINLFAVYFFKLRLIFQQVLTIHTFLLSLSFLTDLLQVKFLKPSPFSSLMPLSINFLRVCLCIIFLLPVILTDEILDKNYIYNFFIVYFLIIFHDLFLKGKKAKK